MACAQTGSGKTGGFLFPVLSESYMKGPAPVPESNGAFSSHKVYPTILVMAPTRELVSQIYEESKNSVTDHGFVLVSFMVVPILVNK